MKKNNKGFSLVELIIVIAIMAILAGALAPALIKYINKSRRSTDVQNADSLRTALQTALSDPDAADADSANDTDIQSASTISESGDAFQKEVYSIVGKASLKTKYAPKGGPESGKTFGFVVIRLQIRLKFMQQMMLQHMSFHHQHVLSGASNIRR